MTVGGVVSQSVVAADGENAFVIRGRMVSGGI